MSDESSTSLHSRGSALPWVLLTAIPAIIVVKADVAIALLAGRPEVFPSVSAYRVVLNFEAVLRFFGVFVAVLCVWAVLRSHRAPRWVLALAILAGPLAYAVTEFFRAQAFFPPDQAAYYAVNPIFVGAVGSQVACAAVAEVLWRWSGRRRGINRGRVVSWPLVATAVVGWAILYVAVLWDGGIHWFYVYQQGYKALFARR